MVLIVARAAQQAVNLMGVLANLLEEGLISGESFPGWGSCPGRDGCQKSSGVVQHGTEWYRTYRGKHHSVGGVVPRDEGKNFLPVQRSQGMACAQDGMSQG
jgi:hypothetical protein